MASRLFKQRDNSSDDTESKLIALGQHPLWIECVCCWWNLFTGKLKPEDDASLSPEQYVDLHVSIQKALLSNFEFNEACSQAWADWTQDSSGEGVVPWVFNFELFNEFLVETVYEATSVVQANTHLFVLGSLLLAVRLT